ncbi:MAG: MarR family transcriptional regulator [Bacteroidetes bacterium]|nr:MarR family transcriptional regulator [Bacteroidota bacterium]MBK8673080.1 MarR family transcriptional regulator [Bacteroidota bacterium]MBL0077658.1 MarR family transcriptional regulator [Bacteroidota bacterium]MBL0286448.1 MarR family transcriptional regulator [Bacteroidota bacterium]
MENLDSNVFYNLDKCIKFYKKYAHKRLLENGFDISIDQWLILKFIFENPDANQSQIAKSMLKDNASVSRIIDILIAKDMIVRKQKVGDKRTSQFKLTKSSIDLLDVLNPITLMNKGDIMDSISYKEVLKMNENLKKIIENIDQMIQKFETK